MFSACSSDDNNTTNENSEFFITFKANGTEISFIGSDLSNTVVGTFNTTNADETNFMASGITGVSDNNNNISILINTLENASINTVYTNYTTDLPKIKSDVYTSGFATDSGSSVFGSLNEEILLVIDGTVADCEIVFTEVTNTSLKGMFSGTLYNFQEGNTAVQITNGEFKVKRF